MHIFLKCFRDSQRMKRAKAPVLLPGSKTVTGVLRVAQVIHLFPPFNAESCLREKRVTGVFSAAGHYTDSMPFNSARRACKSIPASCLLFPRNASSQAAALSWLLVLSWHPECCGLTPSGREQDSRNQRCSQATLF